MEILSIKNQIKNTVKELEWQRAFVDRLARKDEPTLECNVQTKDGFIDITYFPITVEHWSLEDGKLLIYAKDGMIMTVDPSEVDCAAYNGNEFLFDTGAGRFIVVVN